MALSALFLAGPLWVPNATPGRVAPSAAFHPTTSPTVHPLRWSSSIAGPGSSVSSTTSWPLVLGISSNVTAVCAFGSPECSAAPAAVRVHLTAAAPPPANNSTAVQVLFLLDESPITTCGDLTDCVPGAAMANAVFLASASGIANAIQGAHPGRNLSFGLAVTGSAPGTYDDGDSEAFGTTVANFTAASSFGPAVNRSLLTPGDVDTTDNWLQTSVTTAMYAAFTGAKGNSTLYGSTVGPVNWTPGEDHVVVWVGATAPVDSNYTEYACPYSGDSYAATCAAMSTCPLTTGLSSPLPTCEGWNSSQNGNPLDSIASLAYSGSACVNSTFGHCTVDSVILNATSTDASSLGWGPPTAFGRNATATLLDVQHIIGAGCDIARDTGGSWDGPVGSACGNRSGSLGYSPNGTNPWLVHALANISLGTSGGPWLAAPVAHVPMFRFVTTAAFQLAPSLDAVATCATPTGSLADCPQMPSVAHDGTSTVLGWNWSSAAGPRGMLEGDVWSASFDLVAAVGPRNSTPVDVCDTPSCVAAENDSATPTFSGVDVLPYGVPAPVLESFPLLPVRLVVAPALSGSLSTPTSAADAPAVLSFQVAASGGYPPFTTSWEFGDGGFGNSSSAAVRHTFLAPGVHDVKATLRDASGAQLDVSAWVWIYPTLAAVVTPTVSTGGSPLTVTFEATPTGGLAPYSIAWSFGDGATDAGSGPTHIFGSPGVYDVVATVSDSAGGATSSHVTVDVGPVPAAAPLSANATVSSSFTGSCASMRTVYHFLGTASGGEAPYTFTWSFGDGGTAVGESVTHEYSVSRPNPALPNPTLTVTDANGSSVRQSAALPPSAVAGPSCPAAATAGGLAPLVALAAIAGLAAAIVATTVVVLRSRRS